MSGTSSELEQLRSLVAEYLGGHISVDTFGSRFVDLPPTGAPESALRGAIYLALAEYGLDHAIEDELRHELRGMVSDRTMRIVTPAVASERTGTSSRTQIIAFAH